MGSKQMHTLSHRDMDGSITIEAAFAFPVFFFACMALCYLFVFIKAEYVIQREMYYVARDLSGYGAVIEPLIEYRNKLAGKAEEGIYGEDSGKKDIADGIQALTALLPSCNGISLKNLLYNTADGLILGAVMESRIPPGAADLIDGGSSGISCFGSELFDIEKCLVLVCSYELKLPLGMFPDITVPVSHTLRYRYYTGTEVKSLLVEVKTDDEEVKEENNDEEEEEKEDEVLITDTGHRYHYTYACPALNVRPEKILFERVGFERNDGGAKYYPCEICALNRPERYECYITPDGDRYHFDEHCHGLKRTIQSVPLSKVGKRTECKRCRKYKTDSKNEG